ncbi:MAG: preprotein translocase subunit SecA [Bacillota bacterium]
MGLFEKIFGNYSEKEIKKIMPLVKKIEELAPKYEPMSDEELREQTTLFKERLSKGETLDDILPEAYAVVREASSRPNVLSMRHFPVQLIGGIVMHQGRIAEMRTGEGKTLVATLSAYLNALEGKGVHVITVNDYLAQRDSEWIGEVFRFLGLTVGCIVSNMDSNERREAYACDITYGTNNEYGFDYLRDNMVVKKEAMVQRDLHFAIIDEVDSVLIDEARTPLIISGSGAKSTDLYRIADMFAKKLERGRIVNEEDAMNALMKEEVQEEGDFVMDEKAKSVVLTQQGVARAEKFFHVENLSDPENSEIQHHVNNALKANFNMHLDKDYVIDDGEIVIVDEFTGRMMAGRRYSDGLHQAIEAKEQVEVKRESKTLATITFQNYFNKYQKRAGMTGTAKTEEDEFRNTYSMDVVEIPTNRPIQRIDHQDAVYRSEAGKFRAVIAEVKEAHETGQPVLVGTVTIEKSEELSSLLKKEGIKHQVLNAKYHAQEAEIVSDAGQMGAVTIATNMAGRGTDIKLGEGVSELGGLRIIGTERHESRRIDNQLRGRAGRQGDTGCSRFYISLEDDLMRLFGGDRTQKLVDAMGISEDDPIEAGMLSKAIENAQRKVEGNHFGTRKHLLEYDQVMNEQREIIYRERRRVLEGENLRNSILGMIKRVVGNCVDIYIGDDQAPDEWDMAGFSKHFNTIVPIGLINIKEDSLDTMSKEKFKESMISLGNQFYELKEKEINDEERMRELERVIMLRVIDQKWMDHIDDIDRMRQGIGLHAYAQRNPLDEYKFAAFDMFEELTDNIQEDTLKMLYRVRVQTEVQREAVVQPGAMATNRSDDTLGKQPKVNKPADEIGRNDECSCGSGQKYKNCCGRGK